MALVLRHISLMRSIARSLKQVQDDTTRDETIPDEFGTEKWWSSDQGIVSLESGRSMSTRFNSGVPARNKTPAYDRGRVFPAEYVS